MIAIVNISPPGTERCKYEVKINFKKIATFEHFRPDGLAECLRKAFKAVEKERRVEVENKAVEFGPPSGPADVAWTGRGLLSAEATTGAGGIHD